MSDTTDTTHNASRFQFPNSTRVYVEGSRDDLRYAAIRRRFAPGAVTMAPSVPPLPTGLTGGGSAL